MTELMRIADGFDLTPSDEFLSADSPSPMFSEGSEALSGVDWRCDLQKLDALVLNLVDEQPRYSTRIDRELAVALHRMLRIDRRLGSDKRFWAWLGLVRYPALVAWRWKPGAETSQGSPVRSAERFCGSHVRQTFARLWWAVELTAQGEDYELSEKLLGMKGFQDAYEAFFGRAFCQYRPALKAFILKVGDSSEETIRNAAREFGYAISSRVLEVMSESELEDELAMILEDMRTKREGGVQSE